MKLTRMTALPSGIQALTATARGMVGYNMSQAAKVAFGELVDAVLAAGQMPNVRTVMCIVPDTPHGPDDPNCRYQAGMVFGYDMASGLGECCQPDLRLSGTLAWQTLVPGTYAVFTHKGPYETLHETWRAIHGEWLPESGATLRDAPPMEVCLNTPDTAAPQDLLTEIWLPIQA